MEQQQSLDGAVPVPWRTDPPPRRRWPVYVLVVLLVAAGTGASFTAWQNYEAGSGWQRRAEAQQERAEVAESRVTELEDALARTVGLLRRSESDVVLLESRLADLASEKAGAEDTAALATETAEGLTDVIVFAGEVGAELRACVQANVLLLNDLIAGYETGDIDPSTFNRRIDDANTICEEAEDAYADLRSRLDALGG